MKIKWIHSQMYKKILRRKFYWIIQWLHPPQQYSEENTSEISLSVFYDKSSFHQHFGCWWCSSLLLLPAADVVCIRVAQAIPPASHSSLSLSHSRKRITKCEKCYNSFAYHVTNSLVCHQLQLGFSSFFWCLLGVKYDFITEHIWFLFVSFY